MNVLHTKYAFKRGPAVMHLQATDDTIIFSDEDQEKIINIKSGIKVVSAVNFFKSELPRVRLERYTQAWVDALQCKRGMLPR